MRREESMKFMGKSSLGWVQSLRKVSMNVNPPTPRLSTLIWKTQFLFTKCLCTADWLDHQRPSGRSSIVIGIKDSMFFYCYKMCQWEQIQFNIFTVFHWVVNHRLSSRCPNDFLASKVVWITEGKKVDIHFLKEKYDFQMKCPVAQTIIWVIRKHGVTLLNLRPNMNRAISFLLSATMWGKSHFSPDTKKPLLSNDGCIALL